MQKVHAIESHDRKRVSDSITRPANTTQYAAADVISEVTTNDYFTFADVARPGILSGTIKRAILHSSANQATKLDGELWLFRESIGEKADNAAFAPSDAEMLTFIGKIDFATASWVAGTVTSGAGGNAYCETSPDLEFSTGSLNATKQPVIYGQLVARNTYTPISGEVFTCELLIDRD